MRKTNRRKKKVHQDLAGLLLIVRATRCQVFIVRALNTGHRSSCAAAAVLLTAVPYRMIQCRAILYYEYLTSVVKKGIVRFTGQQDLEIPTRLS